LSKTDAAQRAVDPIPSALTVTASDHFSVTAVMLAYNPLYRPRDPLDRSIQRARMLSQVFQPLTIFLIKAAATPFVALQARHELAERRFVLPCRDSGQFCRASTVLRAANRSRS
jgi:hypothetical protein